MYTSRDTAGDAGRGTAGQRSQQAYEELKTRLLTGEFGLGQRLGEERLAGLLGVSRTPVREALARLHTEQLVVRAADGGYLPATPDPVMMGHLYEVRVGLELAALRRPASIGERHDAAVLEPLLDEWRSLGDELPTHEAPAPNPDFVLLDESFHLRLAEAAGNPALVDLLQQVNEKIRIIRMQDFLLPERIVRTVEEHIAIVSATLDGRIDRAETAFRSHVDASYSVVEQRVAQAITRMVRGPGT